MVKEGEASWVILKRTPGTRKVSCELCMGDPDVKNCAGCSGSGLTEISINYEDPGTDIVLVSRPPADKDEKKRSSALAAKTPRVATIEEEHMVRAYVLGFPDAAERIEEYGRLILDARMFVGKNRVPTITVEPEDDPKTGTGRRFDYGRAI